MAGKAFRINNSQIVSRTFVSVVVAFCLEEIWCFSLVLLGLRK